ncbi:MAG: thioredoxin family protein [Terracidiphilus sp.]
MSKVANRDRRRFIAAAAMTIAAAGLGMIGHALAQADFEGEAPSLDGATAWLNSEPLTKAQLRGKVVLFDFWTYSCINWRRTLPYVRAWAERYRDRGLVVVGVHSPEFDFERDIENVRQATKAMMIDYPIAIDNNYAIWRAFNNEYWPAQYFADENGRIRHRKFGEGDYDQSEMVIQRLLAEAGARAFDPGLAPIDATSFELAADWFDLKSPETYLGYERTGNFASPGGAAFDRSRAYGLPSDLLLNHWALGGDWTAKKQAIVLNAADGSIAYRFHARDLHLVMGPVSRGASARFRVLIDGRAPGIARGTDVDDQGLGVVAEPRMYHLIRQPKPIVDRQFEIQFLDPAVQAYSFTFG